MTGFAGLLRSNRNYRFTWTGQVVSEVGDHYNNIAVFSLALANTGSGLVVAGILIARGLAVMLAGPIAGVLLDRMDRKRIMIVSDLVRGVIALAFLAGIPQGRTWLLYALSGLLMFASPFFTAGRASILPTIAPRDELHPANSLTQLTQWTTVMIGSFLGGTSIAGFGYKWAFVFNAFSFLFSAACISRLRLPPGSRSKSIDLTEDRILGRWLVYTEGLRYMRSTPLILGIALVGVGWASGGGAAQILFSLFGEQVFNRGPAGIGIIWGFGGIGLVAGALIANAIGRRIGFRAYKLAISICYLIHGGSYVLFSQARTFGLALVFIALSRAAVAVSSVFEHGPAFAPCTQRISRPRLLHRRIVELDDYDSFHGRRRSRFRSRQSARHRILERLDQFHHGDFLGLGQLHWPPARARIGRSRARRGRGARRPDIVRNMTSLVGRVVLVTGSAKRIGRGIALRLSREGARVAIHYETSEAEARATAAECGGAPIFQANLEKVSEIESLFAAVENHFGRIDGLVNNAARFTRIDPLRDRRIRLQDFVHSVKSQSDFLLAAQQARPAA